MSTFKHRCEGEVYDGVIGFRRCAHRANVERNGKHYCGMHDPLKRKERRAKQRAVYEAKWAAEREEQAAKQRHEEKLAALAATCEQWRAKYPGDYTLPDAIELVDAVCHVLERWKTLAPSSLVPKV